MVELAPSILAADFARLAEDAQSALAGGATLLHVDVMDGHFVPNITIGPCVVESLRKHLKTTLLDVHLMIENPDLYIDAFVDAGANWISVHQENCMHLHRTLEHIAHAGAKPGVVINPATPVETLDEVLPLVNLVLVMSVNPGFGGQKFLAFTLEKAKKLCAMRDRRRLDFRIEMDGGLAADTIPDAVRAGVELLVAGSSVFGHGSPKSNAEHLLKLAREAAMLKV